MTWRLDWESVKRSTRWDAIRSRSRIDAIKLDEWRNAVRIDDLWRAIKTRDWRPHLWLGIACLTGMIVSGAIFTARGAQRDKLQTESLEKLQAKLAAVEAAAVVQGTELTAELNRNHAAEIGALKNQLAAADGKLAEADKKLAALETFQAPRHLTYDQRRALIAALAPFRGQKLTITSVLGNSETRAYRDDFVQVFEAAGWDHNGEAGIQKSSYDIDPTGLEVAVHQINEHEGLSNDAINALIKAMRDLNLFETGGPKMSQMVPFGQFEFEIGYKAKPAGK